MRHGEERDMKRPIHIICASTTELSHTVLNYLNQMPAFLFFMFIYTICLTAMRLQIDVGR